MSKKVVALIDHSLFKYNDKYSEKLLTIYEQEEKYYEFKVNRAINHFLRICNFDDNYSKFNKLVLHEVINNSYGAIVITANMYRTSNEYLNIDTDIGSINKDTLLDIIINLLADHGYLFTGRDMARLKDLKQYEISELYGL